MLFLNQFEWGLFHEGDKVCVHECARSHASVLYLNLRVSAEDMPHLSMTEGLLIGGVMKWEEFLQIERSEQNHTHRDYPSQIYPAS